ncbi:MAG: type II CRISPR-associated endonuclease Cas1 [Clostridia bacterium]|nr:type II CRISPR-associated endonuclease Cas1 [Clostridia bacterium]
MSWRIVSVSSLSKLDYKMDYLVVRNKEGVTRIHLSEISVLILESTAISLTAYLLCELDRRKIAVILCDEKRIPYGVVASLYGSHDTSLHYRTQCMWDAQDMRNVWASIVRAKITGQIAVLPSEKTAEKELMRSYLPQIVPGDETNREGHAAKVYFNALFGMGFTRNGNDPVNTALNYGYGLLLSATAREVTAAGYCTQLGIFHNNRFNRLNLASDLMEPFRPFVDACVRDLAPSVFGKEEKNTLIGVLNRKVCIAGREQYMLNALRIFALSVFDALETHDAERLAFPDYSV